MPLLADFTPATADSGPLTCRELRTIAGKNLQNRWRGQTRSFHQTALEPFAGLFTDGMNARCRNKINILGKDQKSTYHYKAHHYIVYQLRDIIRYTTRSSALEWFIENNKPHETTEKGEKDVITKQYCNDR